MPQPGSPSAGFEPLLPAQRGFVFEQQAEPFRVIEATRFGFVFEVHEPLGHTVQAESVQLFECRMSEHEVSSQW